eukprot:scaffold67310_cov21-Tisochrysis_lutea.AAC.1
MKRGKEVHAKVEKDLAFAICNSTVTNEHLDRYGPRILTNTTVVVEHTVKSDVRSDSPFLQ